MNANFDITTLIFLVVAVVIFLRLRSVLGRRTGHEQEGRYDPYMGGEREKQANERTAEGKDNVVHLPRSNDDLADSRPQDMAQQIAEKIKKFAEADTPLHASLTEICTADRSFDPAEFLSGAKSAYEIIVSDFANGNKRSLKSLLSSEVYDSFVSAIVERDEKGHIVDSNFVGIDKATIIDAELKDSSSNVTVKFVSELIMAVRDKAGEVVDGDPKKIREITDIWTFARDVNSRDPNWKLVATETAN